MPPTPQLAGRGRLDVSEDALQHLARGPFPDERTERLVRQLDFHHHLHASPPGDAAPHALRPHGTSGTRRQPGPPGGYPACPNWLETAVVIDASRDPVASRRFDELVQTAELRVEPVTGGQARIAP